MITNIDIDDKLVAEAIELTGARSKREVVDRALRELVARAKRTRFKDVWGMLGDDDLWPGYDPKTEPGEPPGKYRVEQPVASYKADPAAQPKPRKGRK